MKRFQKKKQHTDTVPHHTLRRDQRGVITVLVVLILVPTIVVEGFLVDLARLKLYGNQAVMTADNYGEAVLSVYNNVLKDLYGLFAISEDKGADALSSLKEFMPSSFNPNQKAISFGHLTGIQGVTGLATKYSGFMPYQDAQVELSYTRCDNANLGNTDVFATQLGDFMRFRVAQSLIDDGTGLLDALDNVKGMEANAKVIKKKEHFDDKVEDVIEKSKIFYEIAKECNQYCNDYTGDTVKDGFLHRVNDARAAAYSGIRSMASDPSLQLYREFKNKEDAIRGALTRQAQLKKGEKLSQSDIELLEFYKRYQADGNARDHVLRNRYSQYINNFKASFDSSPIDFDNFNTKARNLETAARNVSRAYDDLKSAADQLKPTLNDPNVTQEMKDGVQEDLNEINQLFADGNDFSARNFTGLARMVYGHAGSNGYNDTQRKAAESNIDIMKQQIEAYLNGTTPPKDGSAIDTNGYDEFYKSEKYKTLYNRLKEMFKLEGDDNEGKKKKNAAKTASNNASNKFKDTDTSDARDIPSSINIGTSDASFNPGNMAFSRLIDTALSIFSADSFSDGFNEQLLKLYTILYDNEMFSSRVTNKGQDDIPENERTVAESMTGYTLCREINYLFGAELEYLFGGYKSSDANLTSARNKIVAFRAIVNFTASYSISEVNKAIKAISTPVKAINAPVGIALEAALRVAFAMVETAADWDDLLENKGVVLIKNDVDDMTAYDALKDLIGLSGGQKESTAFKMDYETYVTVMLLAMTTDEQIFSRTADLISLNVSTVEAGLTSDGKLSSLSFDMKKAYTAVDATCSVKLDFAVLPLSMANMLLGGDTATLEQIRNRGFRFTVTRGY